MSRLIVKNLANSVTEEKLRNLFGSRGIVTDVQLKYTKDGKFRHFAFVGYKSKEEADSAIEFFNHTFVNATKIQVEHCADLGASTKPKAWSKYASDSTAYKKLNGVESAQPEAKIEPKEKKKKVKDPVQEVLKKHKDDPMFAEFLESHGQDTAGLNKEDSEDSSSEESEEESKEEEKVANRDISDLEYLKLKMEGASDEPQGDKTAEKKSIAVRDTLFNVKLRGLTCKVKKKDVKQFFQPLKPKSIRLARQVKGIAYIGFNTEKEMKQALNKNKSFLGGRQVWVMPHSRPKDQQKDEPRWTQQEESLKNEETIAESGRIFVRNLSYTTSENDLEKLFSQYGPVTEVTVPIDRLSRKVKGFALVTYMIPEHAAKAYADLDGSVFQGRMLHLLPGKPKATEQPDSAEGLTYKQRQLQQQKATAGSSHNWNTLFLGANAVADAMAKTYNTTKERVLDPSLKDSVAVRLALGETQLVAGTRDFLEQNGILLDAFNRPPKLRSKTVILAKNLPAETTAEELKEMFGAHGDLGRIVLPPSGITAIVEFMDPSEARKAFIKLAYSKFKHLPLYLEWAPEDTFVRGEQAKKTRKSSEQNEDATVTNEEASDSEGDQSPVEPDTTLFVKNLNFSTTDAELKQHFAKCGKLVEATVAKKKDIRKPGNMLSMGYGFVQFKLKKDADKALKTLQHSLLNEHALELKRSSRTTQGEVETTRKKAKIGKQTGSKIIIRNVPFQATKQEIQELFKVFGQLKAVRLPRKMVGTGPHRGFAFVDYVTKEDAKQAFKALCQSTHLYGRRLVLEWAAKEETIEELRKRTAQHFHQAADTQSKKSVLQMEEEAEEA